MRASPNLAVVLAACLGVLCTVALIAEASEPARADRAGVHAYEGGTHLLRLPLSLRSGETLRGEGIEATTLRAVRGMDAVVANADVEAGAARIEIRDLTIDCAGRAVTGLRLVRVEALTVRNVRVTGCTGRGAVVSGHGRPTRGFLLSGLRVEDNAGDGLRVQWAMRDGVYDGIIARGNGGIGIVIDHSEATANGLVARGNASHGIHLRNLFATTITGLSSTHNGGHGVLVEGWVHSVGTGWRAQANGQAGPDGSAEVLFSASRELSYGVTRRSVLSGIVVGSYHEMGHAPAAQRGVVVEPGVDDLVIEGLVTATAQDARPPA